MRRRIIPICFLPPLISACGWEITCISGWSHRWYPVRFRYWLNKVLSDKARRTKIAGL